MFDFKIFIRRSKPSNALSDIYVDKFDQTSVNEKNACNFIV